MRWTSTYHHLYTVLGFKFNVVLDFSLAARQVTPNVIDSDISNTDFYSQGFEGPGTKPHWASRSLTKRAKSVNMAKAAASTLDTNPNISAELSTPANQKLNIASLLPVHAHSKRNGTKQAIASGRITFLPIQAHKINETERRRLQA